MADASIADMQSHITEAQAEVDEAAGSVPSPSSDSSSQFTYKLTTTIMLSIEATKGAVGAVNLSGSITRQSEASGTISNAMPHITHIGTLIEEMEIDMRNSLEGLYIQKTLQILGNTRRVRGGPAFNNREEEAAFVSQLGEAMRIRSESRQEMAPNQM